VPEAFMKREVEYSIRLSRRDRYRHKHIRERGRVTYFSIQLETMIEGKWYPIVRYDTPHGFAHRDLLNRKGETITKTPIFVYDYNDALTFAESDLRANWIMYKERFVRG
jgi:hypothetical protein